MALYAVGLHLGVAWAEPSIVHEGEPRAEIVIAEQPAPIVPVAARELQDVIERISGAKLPIVTQRSSDGTLAIFVGRSLYTDQQGLEVADLDYDAYRMVSGEDWLALLGRDDDFQIPEPWPRNNGDRERVFNEIKERTGLHLARLPVKFAVSHRYYEPWDLHEHDGRGTFNAVHAFLRDLGFRRFFPGKIGEVVPTQTTIALPQTDKTVRPDFAVRHFEQYYHAFGQSQATDEEVIWQLSLGLNTGYELRGLGAQGHGLSSITQGRYRYRDHDQRVAFNKSHPEEFYALYDGKRDTGPDGGNQCLSSEKFFETTVAYARAMYDIYDVRVLDLSPDDGLIRMCECEGCQGLGTPERGYNGAMSDYVWGFVNRVAKELYKTHPDRYVTCLVYTTYLLPPEKIEQFSPNVAVLMCTWRTWQATNRTHTPEKLRELRQAWLDMLPSNMMMRWDYFLHAGRSKTAPIPVYFPRLIAQDMAWLKGKAVGELSEVFRNYYGWGRDWHALSSNHLNLYVNARYYWDAEQDIDALLDDYYTKYYGPAHQEMKVFIEYAEQNWMNATKDHHVINRLFHLLEAAQAVAKQADDDVYRQRIDMIFQSMAPLRVLAKQLATGRTDNRQGRIFERNLANLKFDGQIDDEHWKNAWFHLKGVETGEYPHRNKTMFALTWAGDHLYMAIHCQDNDMANLNIGTTLDDDYEIWNGDAVELLLETEEHQYYQIAINPAGAVTDLDRGGGQILGWSSEAEVLVHHGEDYWSAEVRLPMPGAGHSEFFPNELISGAKPDGTLSWYFNVGRQRVRDGKHELWSFVPTGNTSFHDVMKFGKLYIR